MVVTYHSLLQQLGKLSATVECTRRTGKVVLSSALDPGPALHFVFDPCRVARLARPREDVGQLAVRIAITQARKEGLLPGHGGGIVLVELDISLAPWNGDLLAEPYGGATLGVEQNLQRRAMHWSEPERRADHIREAAVEKALHLLKRRRADEAGALLTKHAIPEHVILRVASCAALRRKNT